jgi:hypothetical protein
VFISFQCSHHLKWHTPAISAWPWKDLGNRTPYFSN